MPYQTAAAHLSHMNSGSSCMLVQPAAIRSQNERQGARGSSQRGKKAAQPNMLIPMRSLLLALVRQDSPRKFRNPDVAPETVLYGVLL